LGGKVARPSLSPLLFCFEQLLELEVQTRESTSASVHRIIFVSITRYVRVSFFIKYRRGVLSLFGRMLGGSFLFWRFYKLVPWIEHAGRQSKNSYKKETKDETSKTLSLKKDFTGYYKKIFLLWNRTHTRYVYFINYVLFLVNVINIR
jgi:hypothetical protein